MLSTNSQREPSYPRQSPIAATLAKMSGYLLIIRYAAFLGVLAQATARGGGIHGVVEYPNRHFAAGVTVIAQNMETGERLETHTGISGAYQFIGLPLGAYRVRVDVERFRPFARDLALNVPGWSEAVDVHLEVVASEEVTVVRESPVMIETASDASLGVHFSRDELDELPLTNGQTVQSLVNLVPGTVVTDSVGTLAQFTSTGQRRYANRLTIDGVSADLAVDVIGPGIGQAGSGALPAFSTSGGTQTLVPLAAVEDVAIHTTHATPEYARTPGAQTLIVTRAGGDRLTAKAFTDLRPHQLAANNWFANANQMPRQHVQFLDTGASGGGPIIRGRLFAFGAWERQRIDQSIHATIQVPSQALRDKATPLAASVLNAFPRPNGSSADSDDNGGSNSDLATLTRKVPGTSRLWDLSLRLDAPISTPFRLFTRVNAGKSNGRERGSAGQVIAQSSTVTEATSLRSVTAGLTAVRQAMSNDLRFNVTTNHGLIELGDTAIGSAQPLPYDLFVRPGLEPPDALISVRLFPEAGGLLTSGRAGSASQRQLQVVDTWSFIHGRHEYRAGVDYRHVIASADAAREQYTYRFNTITDLLAGHATQTTIKRVLPARSQRDSLALFAQDSLILSGRWSVSYGLRYTIAPAPQAVRSGDNDLAPMLVDYETLPASNWLSSDSSLWRTSWTNIAPQVSTIWRLRDRPGRETILRAGWSLIFDELTQPGAIAIGRTWPYVQTRTISNSTFPLPASELEGPSAAPFDSTDSNSYFALPRNLRPPRTYTRHIGIEQALGPLQRIDLSYVGAAGRDLIYWSAYPASRQGSLAVINAFSNDATSDYHALLAEYVRRLSHRLQARVAYTWSHAIDTDSGESVTPNLPVRISAPDKNRGSADFDRRHVLQAVASYRIGSDWQLDVMGSLRSGAPVSVLTAIPFGPAVYTVRPDLVPDVPLWIDSKASPTGQRLNAKAFAIQSESRQGTLGRNTVHAFALRQLDLSLARSMRLGTRVRAQFRIDAFNVLNVPNIGPPSTRLNLVSFGVPTKTYAQALGTGTLTGGGLTPVLQVGDARSIQFGIRLGM
jgi:hypothetical protein